MKAARACAPTQREGAEPILLCARATVSSTNQRSNTREAKLSQMFSESCLWNTQILQSDCHRLITRYFVFMIWVTAAFYVGYVEYKDELSWANQNSWLPVYLSGINKWAVFSYTVKYVQTNTLKYSILNVYSTNKVYLHFSVISYDLIFKSYTMRTYISSGDIHFTY